MVRSFQISCQTHPNNQIYLDFYSFMMLKDMFLVGGLIPKT